MERFLEYIPKNIPGVCRIWVGTSCEIVPVNRTCANVDLCGFDRAQPLYFWPQSAELASPSRLTDQGTVYNNTLSFTIPKFRQDVLDFICTYQDQKLSFVVEDKNGVLRLLHNAYMLASHTTGARRSDENRFTFNFVLQSARMPPIVLNTEAFTQFTITTSDCDRLPPPPPDTGLKCGEELYYDHTGTNMTEITDPETGFVIGYSYEVNLDPAGGVIAFWAIPFGGDGQYEAFTLVHNSVPVASSSLLATGNSGPFNLSLTGLGDYPYGPNWIGGINPSFTPDRVAEFIAATGLPTPLPPIAPVGNEQVVWWEYTPADYAISPQAEIFVNSPPKNSNFRVQGLCFE